MKTIEMRRMLSHIIVCVMLFTSLGGFTSTALFAEGDYAEDLFISEYIEGGSNNKAIEIYNGTGSPVDLTDYVLMKDKNGNSEFTVMHNLGGTLEQDAVYVVSHNEAVQAVQSVSDTNGKMYYNGDDQIALYRNGVEIDHIGIPGDKDFAKNVTLVRSPTVKAGVTGSVDPKGNSQWIEYPQDTFTYLGSHTTGYGSLKVANVTAYPPAGAVAKNTEIELSTLTSDAKIYYFIEGEGTAIDVTSGSSVTSVQSINGIQAKEYDGPIEIKEDTILFVKASKIGYEDSDVIELKYTIRPDQALVGIQDAKDNYLDHENPKYFDDHGKQTFRGIVTEVNYQGYAFIQDSTGGVGVKFDKQADLKIGDEIEVYGCLGSYYNFEYIKVDYLTDLKFVGKSSISPVVVELVEVDNDLEGQLITVKNVTIKSGPEYGDEYTVEGGNEDFRIKPKNPAWVSSGVTYDSITGVVYYGYNKYALVPTDEMSIVEDASQVRDVTTDVLSGAVVKGQKVTLNTLTKGAQIYYTTDGSTPSISSKLYTEPIAINSNTELRAIAILDGLLNSKVLERSYFISESVGNKTISELQGESHTSPYLYKTVEKVEGIVTAKLDYQFDRNGSNIKGFYMQSETGDGNNATSDAIFVKNDRVTVNVGQKVKVTGIVKEQVKEMNFYAYDQGNQLSVTTIDADIIEIVSSGNTLPQVTIIGENGRMVPHDKVASVNFSEYNIDKYAIDFYESLEAMRVVVEKPQVVAALHNRVLGIVPDRAKVAKEDGDLSIMGGIILQENDVNTEILSLNKAIRAFNGVDDLLPGATSTGQVEGIMEYEWGTYQIYITKDLPVFMNVGYQKDTLKFNPRDDELTIASYNVYNHGGNAKAEKTIGIARSIVHDMKSPDIVGLVEVQDNDGTSGGTKSKVVDASKTYEAFIENIKNEGGPTYKWVDIVPVDDQEGGAPGGNIRVGFLYNPARVALKTEVDKGTSTQTVQVDENGHLTLNPGRIAATAKAFEETRKSLAAEFIFNGEEVIVIANHFSSKGGDNGIYGNVQPPVKHSEVNRIKQAQLVNDFVDDLLVKNPDARVVVLGDMNDFHFSKAVKTLQGEGSEKILINMINCLPLTEQFTYNYGGNSQVLDHILVSKNLANFIRVDVLNINSIISDEDKANRHSDHDAVVTAIGGIR